MKTIENSDKIEASGDSVPKRKRKRMIITAAILCALVLVYVIAGNSLIMISRYDVHSEKIPPEFDGFCIVQISDLHNSKNAWMTDSLIQKTKSASPDVIFLTGDVIDSSMTDVDSAVSVIEKLIEISPVYYVTGNHEARTGDYYRLSKALGKIGVYELSDSFVCVRLHEDEIVIAGINDPLTAHEPFIEDKVITESRLNSLGYDRDMFTVLLSHRPELMNTYATCGVDLVFSGHAHGGLIRVPLIGGLFAPHQGFFPKYTEGSYRSGSTEMIVSRGVGNSGHTIRINDPPELVVAVLHAGGTSDKGG